MTQTSPARLHFIDVARTWAVFLALLAHLFAATGVFARLDSDAILVRQFTRTATPLFVFMFGFMIEFVYVRRVARSEFRAICRRLVVRSFQCYVAYGLISLCTLLGGYSSPKDFLGSLVLLSGSRFGNILLAYSVMLLISPLIIATRLRFGIVSLFVVLVLLTSSYSSLHRFQSIDFGLLNRPSNILLGIGTDRGGPSVLGALSFYLAGMFIASQVEVSPDAGKRTGLRFALASAGLLVTFASLAYASIPEDARRALTLFANGAYREHNRSAYYIMGIISSVVIISSLRLLCGSRQPPRCVRLLLPLGVSSLISYTVGNMILNLFGKELTRLGIHVSFPLFFGAVLLITTHIGRLPAYAVVNDLLNFRRPRTLPGATR